MHKSYKGLPDSCEVLVKVIASSVNPSDRHPTVADPPKPLGSDISGVIVDTDGTCKRLKTGDAVWADIGANTHTETGARTKELGGYGEFAVALETQLGIKPKNIGFHEAGSLPKVALTSYKALVWYTGAKNASRWQHSPTVLVLGGSGGTGTVGIQLSKAFGADKVITTTSAENADYCKGLGADEVIDYHSQNWWEVVDADSVDVVYDCVGQSGTGDRAMTVLKTGGAYVTIAGALAEHVKPGVEQHMFINSDTNLDNFELLEDLTSLVESEKVRMKHIQQVYPLSEVAKAFEESAGGHVVGKLVIAVNSTASY